MSVQVELVTPHTQRDVQRKARSLLGMLGEVRQVQTNTIDATKRKGPTGKAPKRTRARR